MSVGHMIYQRFVPYCEGSQHCTFSPCPVDCPSSAVVYTPDSGRSSGVRRRNQSPSESRAKDASKPKTPPIPEETTAGEGEEGGSAAGENAEEGGDVKPPASVSFNPVITKFQTFQHYFKQINLRFREF
eukprot:sb/3475244/